MASTRSVVSMLFPFGRAVLACASADALAILNQLSGESSTARQVSYCLEDDPHNLGSCSAQAIWIFCFMHAVLAKIAEHFSVDMHSTPATRPRMAHGKC